MIVSEETRWLYKEIWIWRAFGLIVMFVFITIEIAKWQTLNNHVIESTGYYAEANDDRETQKILIQRNWQVIQDLDRSVDGCIECHAHEKLMQQFLNRGKQKP